MKHAALIFFVVLIATVSFAQPPDTLWTRDINLDCVDVVKTGGFIAANQDSLFRLDEYGSTLWAHEHQGLYRLDVAAVSDGGYVLGGRVNNSLCVTKFDAAGVPEWEYVGYEPFGFFESLVALDGGGVVCLLRDVYLSASKLVYLTANGNRIGSRDLNFYASGMKVLADGLLIPGKAIVNQYWGESAYRLQKVGFLPSNGFLYYAQGLDGWSSWCHDAIELSNGFFLSTGYDSNIGSVLIIHGQEGGFARQIHEWSHNTIHLQETADNHVYSISFLTLDQSYNVSKVNANLEVLWTIEGEGRWAEDYVIANDGGIVLLDDHYSDITLMKLQPEAGVTASTDTQIVPPETSIMPFSVTVDNILLDDTSLDLWTVLYPPDGDPIVSDISIPVTLVPGETLVHEDSLLVLADYPAGDYMCRVHVGDYANNITMGANTFEFTKEIGLLPVVEQAENLLPAEFAMSAYPNPFNASTTLSLALPEPSNLTLAVYNVAGREVAVLHEGAISAGSHQFTFNAESLASGVYFVRAFTPNQTVQRKVMLLR